MCEMERGEPSLVPQWYKLTNGSTTSNARLNQISSNSSISRHSDENGIGFSSRNSLLCDLDRKSSSLKRSFSSNGSISGKSQAYSSFRRSSREKNQEKSFHSRNRENRSILIDDPLFDHDDLSIGARTEKDALRRSQSMITERQGDTWSKRMGNTVNNGGASGVNILGAGKTAFEKDFPSLGLGAEERQGNSALGCISSFGPRTAVQSLPVGPPVIIGTSALAEVPIKLEVNGLGLSSTLQTTPSGQVYTTSNTSTGLNMAEALAQAPSLVRSAPQSSIDTQRIEELTLRKCKQQSTPRSSIMATMASIFRRRIPINSAVLNPRPDSLNRWFLSSSMSSSSSPAAAEDRAKGAGGIEKILVANRGEIACRVMRTARRLGIRTVAVYSDADHGALHVESADEAVRIGPPPARESYLQADAIIDAALRTGAQAIHPGYGFLSESSYFAKLCERKGLTFIGPPASAIRDMGDKSASKRIMGAAGVPLVPGYHGDNQDIEFLKAEAGKIGYPILIKPTHGGGGKGMRIVQGPDEFVESFLAAKREAGASFGIDTVLLEKYITQPRHVEVQVFGDKHGNVIHLNERDCSVQRRHQKIIEEAPAPNVTNEFRAHLGQAAVSAAKAVGYYSAGTVEFIMDTSTGKFYFMEMNTRLQVEHPVTEMIVGQDLVEWQILVANGECLPLSQDEVPLNGHAFEARIYAENVSRGFLPATGTLHHYRPVPVLPTVRVETGVKEGDTVSMHYDPMIAKLVVWGENRNAALIKLKDCLLNFQVAGLPTNINFLLELSNHWAFEMGQVETHFIENFKTELFPQRHDESTALAKLGASLVATSICENDHTTSKENLLGENKLLSLWYTNPPFRMHHSAKRIMELECDKEMHDSSQETLKLAVTHQPDGSYFTMIEDSDIPGLAIKVIQLGKCEYKVDIDGLQTNITLASYSKDNNKHFHLWHGKHHHHFRQTMRVKESNDDLLQHKSSFQTTSHPEGSVLAPMAGLVVKVLVENGTLVEEGQAILVLEAMKMEHVVRAPRTGYVDRLQVATGQQVFDTSVLFIIKGK